MTVEREKGKKALVAYFGGIPLRRKNEAVLHDQVPRMFDGTRSELVKRLLADTCELCEAQRTLKFTMSESWPISMSRAGQRTLPG